jgi:hypothetical protein
MVFDGRDGLFVCLVLVKGGSGGGGGGGDDGWVGWVDYVGW